MVTVKVIESFIDKYTKQNHPLGEVFDVTEERLNEILSIGTFVEVLSKEEEAHTKKAPNRKKAVKSDE